MKLAREIHYCCLVLLGALDSRGQQPSTERHMAAKSSAKPNINTIILSKQHITRKTG